MSEVCVDVTLCLAKVGAAFRPLALERGIDLVVVAPHRLVCDIDPNKLEVILSTLLFRAFKRGPAGSTIRCVATDAEDVRIRVEDDGPELPPEASRDARERTRITDSFVPVRLHGRWFSIGRSRDLAASLGGSLDVLPEAPGGRACLALRLPRTVPRRAAAESCEHELEGWAAALAHEAARQLRMEANLCTSPVARDERPVVLVVGQDRDVHRAIVECLEPEFATASALVAADGLERARTLWPDVVVVDAAFDDETRLLVDTLAADEEVYCPSLVVTTRCDGAAVAPWLDRGAEDVMERPLRLDELRARVQRLVRLKRSLTALKETIGQRDTDVIALEGEVEQTQLGLRRANEDLQVARATVERTNRRSAEFLRMMSHELKTPVTAMTLQLSVFERDPKIVMGAAVRKGFDRIERSVHRLLNLVDTALEWARVGDGDCRPCLETMDLAALVAEVADELRGQAAGRDVELIVDCGPTWIPGDRRILRLILIGLLEQAIAMSSGAPIRIGIRGTVDGQQVEVTDEVLQLGPAQEDELFNPFEHPDGVHRRPGAGSGLGLYAIRDIARATGCDVRIVPGADGGNAFAIEIPDRGSIVDAAAGEHGFT